jgi:Fe-S oxidoreductase
MIPFRLPLLRQHRSTLEKCVYCPKLSRAACPVSNVEASETVTPWGKMSMAYFAARGDVPIDPVHAEPAWACTGCYACRERCDHRNEVARVLVDARAEFFRRDAAPAGAREAVARRPAREAHAESIFREMQGAASHDAPVAVLVGCGYALRAPEVAREALRVTAILTGQPVRPVLSCCGLPRLYAGDRDGFAASTRRLADETARSERLIAVDPGCARALKVDYPTVGVTTGPQLELWIDLVHRSLGRLRQLTDVAPTGVRYHDPCQLGRGLDRYDEPRAILARITGDKPLSFQREREQAECSGAGGLLPVTRPETSRAMADARIAEHGRLGGGLLVTACAQSLVRFRTRGEPAQDLVSLVARALD